MSNVTTCLANLSKKYGFDKLDESARKSIHEHSEAIEKAMRDMSLDAESKAAAMKDITKSMNDTYKKAVIEKAQQKTAEATMVVRFLDKARELAGGKDITTKHLEDAVKEIIWGEGGSVMFQKVARKNEYSSGFFSRLLEKDNLDIVRKSQTNKSVNEELLKFIHDLSDGYTVDELKLSHFDKTQAQEIYKAVRYAFDRIFFDKKQAGIQIGKQPNYVGRRRYSVEKVAAMDKVPFVEFMTKHVDSHESFSPALASNPAEQKVFFEELYDKFTTGKSSYASLEDNTFTPFIRSRLKERQLVFKKGSSFEVFKQLSPITDFSTLIAQEIDEASSIIANYRFFGPSPSESVANASNSLLTLATKQGMKPVEPTISIPGAKKLQPSELLQRQTNAIANEFEKASRALTEKPANQVSALGYFLQSMNNMQVATKLGSTSIFTALPTDFVTTLMTTMQDRGVMQAILSSAQQAKRTFQLLVKSDAELLQLQRASMVQVDVANMTWQDKLGPEFAVGMSGEGLAQGVTRATSKYAGWATKFSLLNHQYKVGFLNSGLESLHTLGMIASKEYSDNKFLQRAFGDLNLNAREKELFHKLKIGIDGVAGGERMLDVHSVFDIPLEEFASDTNVAKGRRTEFLDKLTGFANSRAGQGSPTPNLRTAFKKGNKITNMDMMMKALFLFKNTIWHITDISSRQISRVYEVGGASSLVGGASFIGAHALMTYAITEVIASAIVDQKSKTLSLLEGDVEGFAADFTAKMSPMPIYTDAIIRLIEQRNRWGQSAIMDVLTGPNGSMIRDLENVMKTRKKGQAAARFAGQHILPLSNFGVKGAFRHLFDYDIRGFKKQKKKDEFRLPDF